jgi:hypothetical protein
MLLQFVGGCGPVGLDHPEICCCRADTATFSGLRARLDPGVSSQQHLASLELVGMDYSNFVCLATDRAAAVSVVEVRAFITTEGILAVIT